MPLIGDTVNVPDPNLNDLWNNEFQGTVVALKRDTDGTILATVEDMDGDCFDVERDRLERENDDNRSYFFMCVIDFEDGTEAEARQALTQALRDGHITEENFKLCQIAKEEGSMDGEVIERCVEGKVWESFDKHGNLLSRYTTTLEDEPEYQADYGREIEVSEETREKHDSFPFHYPINN